MTFQAYRRPPPPLRPLLLRPPPLNPPLERLDEPRLLKLRELEPLLMPPNALPPPDVEVLLGRAVGAGVDGRVVGLWAVVGRAPVLLVEGRAPTLPVEGRAPVLGCVEGRAAEEEP